MAKLRPVIVSDEAALDLADALAYYAAESPESAAKLESEFIERLLDLEYFPEMYREVYYELRRISLKTFPYNIFYITTDHITTVLAVTHSARNEKVFQDRWREFKQKN